MPVPAAIYSPDEYWVNGLTTIRSDSFGIASVTGKKFAP
jgi:hypothetical protein